MSQLHAKKAFAVVHKCLLFLARCYSEAYKCSRHPAVYLGAESEVSCSDCLMTSILRTGWWLRMSCLQRMVVNLRRCLVHKLLMLVLLTLSCVSAVR